MAAPDGSDLMDWRARRVRDRAVGGRPVGARHAVTIVTRTDCHLCDVALATLQRLAVELDFDLAEVDVDTDPDRLAQFADLVPVILLDGREHGYWRVEEDRLRAALSR